MESLLARVADSNQAPIRLILPVELIIRQSTVGELVQTGAAQAAD
jgi:DNA-binding LacI/PurR family transcriptional regulator